MRHDRRKIDSNLTSSRHARRRFDVTSSIDVDVQMRLVLFVRSCYSVVNPEPVEDVWESGAAQMADGACARQQAGNAVAQIKSEARASALSRGSRRGPGGPTAFPLPSPGSPGGGMRM